MLAHLTNAADRLFTVLGKKPIDGELLLPASRWFVDAEVIDNLLTLLETSNRLCRRRFLRRCATLAPSVLAARGAARSGLKIYVHWDMEGASGIFQRDQAWFWEEGASEQAAAHGRELFTADVNAVSTAALDAGVDQLIICDTHHGGGNLVRDRLLQDARIIYHHRSVEIHNGKRCWMPGLDETVAGLMLPGHHAKAGTPGAFLPHTSSREWADFRINGLSVGEIGIQACYAGHWNIPLILVEGDEAACNEARQQFPGVVTAVVKRFQTPDVAVGPDPDSAHRATALKVAEAVEKVRSGKLRPFKTSLPMTVTLRLTTAELAAKAATRPGVRRLDDNTVESRVSRQCDVMQWIQGLGPDMAPA